MVSFMLIETGLPEGVRKVHSEQWENTLFDVFFDSGFITSNIAMQRLDYKPQNGVDGFLEANIVQLKNGGSDFFLIVQLDYGPEGATPENISFYLYKISQRGNIHALSANGYASQKIFTEKIEGKKYRSSRDEIADIKKTAMGLVPYFK